MFRLFTGIELPASVVDRLSGRARGLPGAHWVPAENYHLTLRFIGDVESHIADAVVKELDRINHEPFPLTIAGFGVFGGDKPHSVWADIRPNAALVHLQAAHERAIQRAGLAPEGRKFVPHVTLARLKRVTPAAVAAWLQESGEFTAPTFEVTSFALYSARPFRGGGPYVVEERFALGRSREEDDGEA